MPDTELIAEAVGKQLRASQGRDVMRILLQNGLLHHSLDQLPVGPPRDYAMAVGVPEETYARLDKKARTKTEHKLTCERKIMLAIWLHENGEPSVEVESTLFWGTTPCGKEKTIRVDSGAGITSIGEVGYTGLDRFSYAIVHRLQRLVLVEPNSSRMHVFEVHQQARVGLQTLCGLFAASAQGYFHSTTAHWFWELGRVLS